jgi:hypothetical protein
MKILKKGGGGSREKGGEGNEIHALCACALITQLYVRVGILRTCENHLHDCVVLLRGEKWVHQSE